MTWKDKLPPDSEQHLAWACELFSAWSRCGPAVLRSSIHRAIRPQMELATMAMTIRWCTVHCRALYCSNDRMCSAKFPTQRLYTQIERIRWPIGQPTNISHAWPQRSDCMYLGAQHISHILLLLLSSLQRSSRHWVTGMCGVIGNKCTNYTPSVPQSAIAMKDQITTLNMFIYDRAAHECAWACEMKNDVEECTAKMNVCVVCVSCIMMRVVRPRWMSRMSTVHIRDNIFVRNWCIFFSFVAEKKRTYFHCHFHTYGMCECRRERGSHRLCMYSFRHTAHSLISYVRMHVPFASCAVIVCYVSG